MAAQVNYLAMRQTAVLVFAPDPNQERVVLPTLRWHCLMSTPYRRRVKSGLVFG